MGEYRRGFRVIAWGLCAVAGWLGGALALGGDQPQWGRRWSRNMVSDEKSLVDSFDVTAGRNVKWTAQLGTECYSTATVAAGRVFIGTNNQHPRDPRHQGDRGVLLCLDEKDGHLLWQLVVPKLEDDIYLDWPKAGMVSPPTIEGNRVYTITNRAEVVCLDLAGMANGNDGPYQDEARHMTPRGEKLMDVGPTDADIIWVFDLVKQAGIHPHDQAHASILIDGDVLYLNTCNGVDNTHRRIRCPDAPNLVALDKRTGRLLAKDAEPIGPKIFHCLWSSPSMGRVGDRSLLFFGGGDGVCYGLEALAGVSASGDVGVMKTAWRFDPDPQAPKENVHKWTGNRKEGPSVIMGMPVFDNGRVYFARGGDLWWGKRQGWLHCIDASNLGEAPKEIWSYTLAKNTCCTPAVYAGMVFAADVSGTIHCVDAATGKPYWTHQADGEIWGSPLVADGKLYVGTRHGQFVIMDASKTKRVISTTELDAPINCTTTAANGVLFISTMRTLYAIGR